jgi:FMN phosphatase YigB (HAD superfamily)
MPIPRREWIARALGDVGMQADDASVDSVASKLVRTLDQQPPSGWDRQDTDRRLHRQVHDELFERAGLDASLGERLYQLESDTSRDLMADDVPEALESLAGICASVVILSDIHVDIRPWFEERGLDGCITDYVLSFEHGIQKPDEEIFCRAVAAGGASPRETVMVGDRASHDGGAVAVGIPTLLLPPLRDPSERRLDRAVAAVR